MDFILSPWTWATTEILTFYRYFFSLNYTGRALLLMGLILPIISNMRLRWIINEKRKRKELAQDLIAFKKKYAHDSALQMLPTDNHIYDECVSILEKSGVISPSLLYFFKESRMPPVWQPVGHFNHPNQVRSKMINDLIDHALGQTL